MKRYNSELSIPVENPVEYIERDNNVRRHYQSLQVAVVIPLIQSVVTGIFVAIIASITAASVHMNPWKTLGIVFVIVTFLTWLYLQNRWSKFVMALEGITGLDINLDGKVERKTVEIQLTSEDGKHVQFLELPDITLDQWNELASGLLAGQSFSEQNWSGHGRPFTRQQVKTIRGELLSRGWLEWRRPEYPGQGTQLTRPGQAVMRELARRHA